jgi:hypothetical protein
VLDPESLESGATYDLRVYICNSSGQNRQVNLVFVGDGQAAVETGFFNEDDARTSAGGFTDRNQVYYINYRFTWDGDSTPGITITQKVGSAPFVLYALTNQVVNGGAAAGEAAEGAGLTTGLVNTESDEVGVASDDFYTSESLNTNGQWVKLDKWGTCWQPTKVASGWCPYTNGNWKECDDCGWTFVSDEPWAWCCYSLWQMAKVKTGCGWCGAGQSLGVILGLVAPGTRVTHVLALAGLRFLRKLRVKTQRRGQHVGRSHLRYRLIATPSSIREFRFRFLLGLRLSLRALA